MVEEIIEAIENDTLYDFVANNYYAMGHEELKEVLLNVIYVYMNANETKKAQLIQEIKERMLD